MLEILLLLLLWGLLTLIVQYYVKKSEREKIELYGYVNIIFYSKRFDNIIEKGSKMKFWDTIGKVGTSITMIMSLIVTFFLFLALYSSAFMDVNKEVTQPQNIIIIPGVNDFLPLIEGPLIAIALAIIILVHELGHAIMAKHYNVENEGIGIILTFLLPLGAAAMIDDKQLEKRPLKERLNVLSGGITFNIILLLIVIILSTIIIFPLISTTPGGHVATVDTESTAYNEGLERGDIIIEANQQKVTNNQQLSKIIEDNEETIVKTKTGTKTTITQEEIQLYPSDYYLNILKGQEYSIPKTTLVLLTLPFHGILIGQGIDGFSGFVHMSNFYQTSLPFDTLILSIGSLSFWMLLFSLAVILFNVAPISILDGGRIFKELLKTKTENTKTIEWTVYTILILTVILTLALPHLR